MRIPADIRESVRAAASGAAPAGSLAFCIGDHHCGLIVPDKMVHLKALPERLLSHFEVTTDCVRLSPPEGGTTALEAFLADLAVTLHRRLAFRQWRNELLDVQTDRGVLCRAERGLFRFLGMTTDCVHAVGMTADGRIFVSRRSARKMVAPGLWDTLSGGMRSAGESFLQALERETAEEAGLDPGSYTLITEAIRTVATSAVFDGWMCEVTLSAGIEVHPDAVLSMRDGEVDAIECITPDTLFERIRERSVTREAALSFISVLERI